jgi:hypothetical protein|tara:strand:+ start:2044 stop:2898 length:855 start_codon:yes stop_codon:yes gene_type:complete
MTKLDKKVLENVIFYNKMLKDRNLFIILGLVAVLIISALLKYFNVLEGFGDLTKSNIGPVTNDTMIRKSTWNGIKQDVFRKTTNDTLQNELKLKWNELITEKEGLHYALHREFPYPDTVKKCVISEREKEYRNRNLKWDKKAINKENKDLEHYQTTLPIRSFVKLAKYNKSNCLYKIPELEFLNKLNNDSEGVTTFANKKLYCEAGNSDLRAFDVSEMNGEKQKRNPHYVDSKELENVAGFTFVDKPCNPCEDMEKCKFALNNKISPVAKMYWGIENASNSQIL